MHEESELESFALDASRFPASELIGEIFQLALNERDPPSDPPVDADEVRDDGEVDDLESSLLKVSLMYDKENQVCVF